MDLTEKEITLIKAAISSKKNSKIVQPFLFLVLIAAIILMLFGSISGDQFAYFALPLIFITALFPQMNGAPKYEQLVSILEKQLLQQKSSKKQSVEDSIAEAFRPNKQ